MQLPGHTAVGSSRNAGYLTQMYYG